MLVCILAFVLRILLYEISYYLAIRSYKNQPGVFAGYKFIIGMLDLYAGADPDDLLSKMSNFYEKNSEKDIIVQNFPGLQFGTVQCILNSHKAIKDF